MIFYTGARYRATRTKTHPRRPPPLPKRQEEKGVAEAPSSASATPALREQGVSTYIGHCSDLYRSSARPIVVRMRTNIGSLVDHSVGFEPAFHYWFVCGTNSGMNANDYCSAPPPPLFLLRHAPIQSPPLQTASDRDALLKGKAKPNVLVGIVTSTGKWW